MHIYFTLKDANAQIPCAFFRQHHTQNTKDLANGQRVLVRAKLSLYTPRGSYQLIVSQIEAFGAGLLELQFQALKLKLEKIGLFDPGKKNPFSLCKLHWYYHLQNQCSTSRRTKRYRSTLSSGRSVCL